MRRSFCKVGPPLSLNISKLALKSVACKTEGCLLRSVDRNLEPGELGGLFFIPPALSGFLGCSHQTNLCFSLWIIREFRQRLVEEHS